MSATSWLSAQGLAGDWPVVEVQYQALSVSSSFHFLPPLSGGCSQWHKHTASCDWLGSLPWKWKDHHHPNSHIHSHASEKGLFKTLKCSGVVFLNRPRKLWQMVYYFTQYFISGTFNCRFLTSKQRLLTHSVYLHTVSTPLQPFLFRKTPFPFFTLINLCKMSLKIFYKPYGSYIFCQDSDFVHVHRAVSSLCLWITLSDTHRYMHAYTHMDTHLQCTWPRTGLHMLEDLRL